MNSDKVCFDGLDNLKVSFEHLKGQVGFTSFHSKIQLLQNICLHSVHMTGSFHKYWQIQQQYSLFADDIILNSSVILIFNVKN